MSPHQRRILIALVAVTITVACYLIVRAFASWPHAVDDRIAAAVGAVGLLAGLAGGATWRRDLPARTARPQVLLWRTQSNGRILCIDQQLAAAFGYGTDELIGKSLAEMAHPSERERITALVAGDRGWGATTLRCSTRSDAPLWIKTSATRSRHGLDGYAELIDYQPVRTEANRAARAAVAAVIAQDRLVTAFQPIVCVATGALLGVEALSRFTGDNSGRSPEDWFADASSAGLGAELELHAINTALAAAAALPSDIYVSVNLSADSILWPGTLDALTQSTFDPARLVIEVTERDQVADYTALAETLRPFRDHKMRVAIDDVGTGYAGLRHILRLEPDYIKLDRSIISGIDTGAARRAMTAAITTFANKTGATVIAEGIETELELVALRDLGVTAAQGYLLHKPSVARQVWSTWASTPPPWCAHFAIGSGESERCRTCTAPCPLAGNQLPRSTAGCTSNDHSGN